MITENEIDWKEVEQFYKDFRSIRATALKFKISKYHARKFLIEQNLFKPHYTKYQRTPVDNGICNIGDKYHRWTIIGDKTLVGRRYLVPVLCECGTKTTIRLSALINETSQGCRQCINKNNYPSSRKMGYNVVNYKGIYNSWLSSLRGNSKRGYVTQRIIEVDVTLENLYVQLMIQNNKCALSGVDLEVLDTQKLKSNASIDRINSSMGYTKDNIQWVLKSINLMKNNFSQQYFIETCNKIFNYQKDKQDNPEPSL